MTRKLLLICGIASSFLYVAMNIFLPLRWSDYSPFSQTISELSAIDAPTRAIWVPLGVVYTLLIAACGAGVRQGARSNRPLRIVGGLLITYGLFGLGWPPMHQREVLAAGGGTMTDTMHIVWSVITVGLMMLAIGVGSVAFGRRFRAYSVATIVALVAFGALTFLDAPRVGANLPTPWLGVWERINVGVFMLWVVVLAVTAWRTAGATALVTGRDDSAFKQTPDVAHRTVA